MEMGKNVKYLLPEQEKIAGEIFFYKYFPPAK